jgi:predicted tellurium resistance membrane protein TerC
MFNLGVYATWEGWISLLTLAALEILLGIDNIIFISILSNKLPPAQRSRARSLGLIVALMSRIALLCTLSWLLRLTEPLFEVCGRALSGRDLILLAGGLFLVGKAVHEIHEKLEVQDGSVPAFRSRSTLVGTLIQIMLLDLVFSLDSVITAVGMASAISVMIAAMIVAVGAMLLFAGALGSFVERHPTLQVLALSFLLLIGLVLMADAVGQHVSKGTIYFAMAFAFVIELINMRMRRKLAAPVTLHHRVPQQ